MRVQTRSDCKIVTLLAPAAYITHLETWCNRTHYICQNTCVLLRGGSSDLGRRMLHAFLLHLVEVFAGLALDVDPDTSLWQLFWSNPPVLRWIITSRSYISLLTMAHEKLDPRMAVSKA